MKAWLISRLGGYPTIEDAIWAIKTKGGPEKYQILTLAVKKLYNTIGPDDILRANPQGQWVIEGKEISLGKRDLLVAEAKHFVESELWKVLQADIKYQANRKMYELGKSDIDLIAGKLWTFTLDAFKTRLNSIKSGQPVFNANAKE